MPATIAVVDYGLGNLHSVRRALEHVAPRSRVIVTANPSEVLAADRVVFPGQGAIGVCMAELRRHGLEEAVRVAAADRPFLGICLGPQALLEFSEENEGVPCLGVLPGRVKRFATPLTDGESGVELKVPHMGWSRVWQSVAHPLWEGIEDGARFYFVHSYYPVPTDSGAVAGETEYGVQFASAVAAGGVFAVQFHPEKSAHDGLRLLANFARWIP